MVFIIGRPEEGRDESRPYETGRLIMVYNPEIHHRRSIRLREYDYSSIGAYFFTICTWQRECRFGDVVAGKIRLNESGRVVDSVLLALPEHHPNVQIDPYVIMPNHFHGILMVGARFIAPMSEGNVTTGNHRGMRGAINRALTIGEIIRAFKARCTHGINQICNTHGPVWQRNYYERVIRDEAELARAREYIDLNPSKWEEDENHPSPPHTPPTLSSTVISNSAR